MTPEARAKALAERFPLLPLPRGNGLIARGRIAEQRALTLRQVAAEAHEFANTWDTEIAEWIHAWAAELAGKE